VVAHVVSHFLRQYRAHVNDLRVAMPDLAEGDQWEVIQEDDIAPPKAARVLERHELLVYLDNFCLDKGVLHTGDCDVRVLLPPLWIR